jgi:iron complex transport system permease protein
MVVSFTDAICFVCLFAPHICLAFIDEDERVIIVASSLFGANLLLVADLFAQIMLAPIMLPEAL